MWFECEASATLNPRASSSQRDFPETKWIFTVTQTWNTEFKIVDGWLRIPVAWGYLADITIWGWTSNFTVTVSLKIWSKTLMTWTWNNGETKSQQILNFWKFDVIEFRASWHYNGSASWASTNAYATIKLKKI